MPHSSRRRGLKRREGTMSLLGVLSKEPLYVRAGVSNGSGWGSFICDAARTWRLAAHRGGAGSAGVFQATGEWALFSSRGSTRGEAETRGHAFLASVTTPSSTPYLMHTARWVFVYEGSIGDVDALRAALDPAWAPHSALRSPGDLVCTHLLTYLASLGMQSSDEVALKHATRGLERAKRLGASAFVCSDGDTMYAYSIGGMPLFLSNVSDAIVVGTPEVVPDVVGVRPIPIGTLLSLTRSPQLGWSFAAPKYG